MFRCISSLLGAILHAEHNQRCVSALRPVRHNRCLPDRPESVFTIRLAGIHKQFPQPGHLYDIQHRISQGIQ
jgi:hypothetical protein